MSDPSERQVLVEIVGQHYTIETTLDAQYVAELATYVDEKMRAAANLTPGGDMQRLAVIVALNIADEYFKCRDADRSWQDDLRDRAQEIERLVDQALTA